MLPSQSPLPLGEGQGEGRRTRGTRAPAALPLALALCLGCAPTPPEPEPRGTQPHRVVHGTEAPGDEAVVALVARRSRCAGEELTPLCTGVLVGRDVVLTAAHCLELFGERGPYEVYFGEQLLAEPGPGGRFVRVERARGHPRFERATHAFDAAVLKLARPVEVPPVPRLTPGSGALAVGVEARVVGYGETRDAGQPAGRRRQGMLVVTQVEAAAFRAGPAPAMSCVGDSGGPVLVREGGGEVLAGLTASGDVACRAEALNVRVDALEDFLGPFLEEGLPEPPRVLQPEALCREACTRDEECPSGLLCEALEEGGPGRCLLPGLREGAYGAECTSDAACGAQGLCARLEPEGAGACRCFTPCDAPPPEDDASGCASAPGPLLLGLLAWAAARRTACRGPGETWWCRRGVGPKLEPRPVPGPADGGPPP